MKLPASFRTSKGILGIALVVTVLLIAIIAPMLIPDTLATKMDMRARLSPPTWAHPLGTDQLGRDLLYRVLLGAQTSILIASAAVLMSILIGMPLGLISGYAGGTTDNVLMRLVDTLLAFPALLLALTISAVLGPNLQNTIIAIGIAFAPFLARIIRGEALRVAQMPYVEAARTAGNSDLRLIVRHIGFLGLGTQPPDASWGLMIQASRDYLDRAPWTALVPGAAVALTVLGLNMFGDALRDALDPRSKGGAG